jgi:hypothetical protein
LGPWLSSFFPSMCTIIWGVAMQASLTCHQQRWMLDEYRCWKVCYFVVWWWHLTKQSRKYSAFLALLSSWEYILVPFSCACVESTNKSDHFLVCMVLWAPLQHGNFIDVFSALLMKTLNGIMLNVGFMTENMVFPVFLVF